MSISTSRGCHHGVITAAMRGSIVLPYQHRRAHPEDALVPRASCFLMASSAWWSHYTHLWLLIVYLCVGKPVLSRPVRFLETCNRRPKWGGPVTKRDSCVLSLSFPIRSAIPFSESCRSTAIHRDSRPGTAGVSKANAIAKNIDMLYNSESKSWLLGKLLQ